MMYQAVDAAVLGQANGFLSPHMQTCLQSLSICFAQFQSHSVRLSTLQSELKAAFQLTNKLRPQNRLLILCHTLTAISHLSCHPLKLQSTQATKHSQLFPSKPPPTHAHMDSHSTPADQPTTPAVYEVTHHQAQNTHLLIILIGTFSTLYDAQIAAQTALKCELHHYIAQGWRGCFYTAIDLVFAGLITGCINPWTAVPLSEIRIREMARALGPTPAVAAGVVPVAVPATSAAAVTAAAPAATQVSLTPPHSFAQTRPSFPNRPDVFVPRPNGQYDKVMRFGAYPEVAEKKEAKGKGKARRNQRGGVRRERRGPQVEEGGEEA
ncbi:hypothetical protein OPT61_g9539 [Boeremia exigua]|uniref:Uncharacterized protein n=1 Tax=Boeremia exigua TaxID=749465 RepID=A0ACC2HTU9_9PLEO|nr:hypothetical protein OPT61_g9539 [Boeremia exigua]